LPPNLQHTLEAFEDALLCARQALGSYGSAEVDAAHSAVMAALARGREMSGCLADRESFQRLAIEDRSLVCQRLARLRSHWAEQAHVLGELWDLRRGAFEQRLPSMTGYTAAGAGTREAGRQLVRLEA